MRTTVNIPEDLISQAMAITDAKSRSEAVRRSLEDLIKRNRVKTFLESCESLGFEYDWKKQRASDAESSR